VRAIGFAKKFSYEFFIDHGKPFILVLLLVYMQKAFPILGITKNQPNLDTILYCIIQRKTHDKN